MINYDGKDTISIHPLLQTLLRYQLVQSVAHQPVIAKTLTVTWYETLLRFFIHNESIFKSHNSFAQLLETREHFAQKFKNQYNDNMAELDLMVAPVYYYQERFDEYRKSLDKVNLYLSGKPDREFLKSKLGYLYSAYFRKKGDYNLAEQKLNEAINIFAKIKPTENYRAPQIRSLQAKILFNEADLIFYKNRYLPQQERDITSLKYAASLTRKMTSICMQNKDMRNTLKSVELRGRLLSLLNDNMRVIKEFSKYDDILEAETSGDIRLRMVFYMTYSDAYLTSV